MNPTRRTLLQTALAAGLAPALPIPAAAATTEDWSSDVAILREAWTTMHPGLYRYSTSAEISERLDGLAREWAAPGSFKRRFLALTRVTASVRCGHTYPSPYNGGDAVVAALYPDRALVPFRFRWLDGRMIVTRDDSGTGAFTAGTEVLAIDGAPVRTLLEQLIPLARADGGNDAKRTSLMEVRGDDGYETFDIHLPLVLPLPEEASFTLGDGRRVGAQLLTLEQRRSGREPAAAMGPDANPWTLDHGSDGIAVLTMPGWALYDSTFEWEHWLGAVMDDLTGDGARGLIVDLRGNEGGEDCGNLIISRLISSDLRLTGDQRWVRYRRAPDSLRPYLDTWDRSFLDWGDQAVESGDHPGFFRLTRYDDGSDATVIAPRGRRFEGPVAVLCDASNSSATFGFARTIKDNGLGRLIGQATGGNRRGINGGAFFFLRLPASGLEVDLPLIAGFPQTPQPDAPIDPDLYVPTTQDDIATGRDPQMSAARRWIASIGGGASRR